MDVIWLLVLVFLDKILDFETVPSESLPCFHYARMKMLGVGFPLREN